MNLQTYDPLRDLRNLREEVNRVFGRTVSGWPEDNSSVATSVWSPAVDLKEEKDSFVLKADLPGVNPKDIEVTMENGVLTIRGERHFESEQDRSGYRRVERTYGSFYRRFALPDSVDAERIEAHTDNGVLHVTIPKAERAKPRQIAVKATS
ncbi:MAG: Hsp20/alpha crystallin family protein [Gammaproteobacteria bacterium]|nr:Hsp20/alpha crystallin family protein [Gammaproteobacteria bacterium]